MRFLSQNLLILWMTENLSLQNQLMSLKLLHSTKGKTLLMSSISESHREDTSRRASTLFADQSKHNGGHHRRSKSKTVKTDKNLKIEEVVRLLVNQNKKKMQCGYMHNYWRWTQEDN